MFQRRTCIRISRLFWPQFYQSRRFVLENVCIINGLTKLLSNSLFDSLILFHISHCSSNFTRLHNSSEKCQSIGRQLDSSDKLGQQWTCCRGLPLQYFLCVLRAIPDYMAQHNSQFGHCLVCHICGHICIPCLRFDGLSPHNSDNSGHNIKLNGTDVLVEHSSKRHIAR